ncbi:MAG TPA: mobile mystery protein B [Chlamydiales bacterium]|nr:mobile mystery protein B [Chlamydiales bacterium]
MFKFPKDATPINDISGLKVSWVTTLDDLNKVEAENISFAIEKYLLRTVALPDQWFNIFMLQKIHKDMFYNVWKWAGSFRSTQTSIGIKPYLITNSLRELCLDVSYWCSEGCELTLVEQAARIHHRLVWIHPYANGNGRFSRLIADRYLKSFNCSFPVWPIKLNEDGVSRKQYIESLKEADGGNFEPLVEYMIKCGAKDPSLSILLSHAFYKKNFKGERLELLLKAYRRRGYDLN